MIKTKEKQNNIWENFEVNNNDIDFIFNRLFEVETPTNTIDLIKILIQERIRLEKIRREGMEKSKGEIYLPKDDFQIGQKLTFPALNYISGELIGVRPGNNPELGDFSVIQIDFQNGESREFASRLVDHPLNQTNIALGEETDLEFENIFSTYTKNISASLIDKLNTNQDLVQIAGFWFPRSLLIDINIGYLNLAEAVLEVSDGGPLSTQEIINQIELPTDSNSMLTEFSLNFALQEDPRFDEVGPAGKTLWFLHRSEPENVRSLPKFLIPDQQKNFDNSKYSGYLAQMNAGVFDELEYSKSIENNSPDGVTIAIIYPHIVSGSIPLSSNLEKLFPTAYESPRIRFTFVDGDTQEKFAGWVIRESKYVYGLKEWYERYNVLPGSRLHIKPGKVPGEVIVSIGKKRPTREWVRTATRNIEGKISFSMTKQLISTEFDDRMIIAISEREQIETLWDRYLNVPAEKLVPTLVRELAKLNPQGHVHAQELYAAYNIVKRVSPSYVLYLLENSTEIEHLGDLYFRIKI
ncbi:MAG: hypothetical protein CVU40_02845 [Chloroflexi bacterium HGW-Chloroflexi-2]|jgi:hypothetical protein|nr:MAG: hypothetical protein CVU40_02845 [Chloroflexi bacterium HGW-Chloroflexi-2]